MWVLNEISAGQDHSWQFGDSKPQVRRARAIHKRLATAGIAAKLEPWPYGGLNLSFPATDYQRATDIADTCYVGETWWPTKGTRRRTLTQQIHAGAVAPRNPNRNRTSSYA